MLNYLPEDTQAMIAFKAIVPFIVPNSHASLHYGWLSLHSIYSISYSFKKY